MVLMNDGQEPRPHRLSLRDAIVKCTSRQAKHLQLARIWLPCAVTLLSGMDAVTVLDEDQITVLINML